MHIVRTSLLQYAALFGKEKQPFSCGRCGWNPSPRVCTEYLYPPASMCYQTHTASIRIPPRTGILTLRGGPSCSLSTSTQGKRCYTFTVSPASTQARSTPRLPVALGGLRRPGNPRSYPNTAMHDFSTHRVETSPASSAIFALSPVVARKSCGGAMVPCPQASGRSGRSRDTFGSCF